MRLADLNPRWVGAGGEGISDGHGNPVPERSGVAISFDCPCGAGDRCVIEFSNPLDGGPTYRTDGHTWERTGETFEELTLRPSIQRMDACRWHGFLTNGEFTQC